MNLHERLTALLQADSVPMSDAWASLLDDIKRIDDQKPVSWTDAEELRGLDKNGCAYMFKDVTPNHDTRRVINLYREPVFNPIDGDDYSPALHFVPCLEEAVGRTGKADFHLAAKLLESVFVITPRVRFERTNDGLDILRGEEVVGTIYHYKADDIWFLNIPGHQTGDKPGIKGEMRARMAASEMLDQPA